MEQKGKFTSLRPRQISRVEHIGRGSMENAKHILITAILTAIGAAFVTSLMEIKVFDSRIAEIKEDQSYLVTQFVDISERLINNEKALLKLESQKNNFAPCIRSLCIEPDRSQRTTIQKP